MPDKSVTVGKSGGTNEKRVTLQTFTPKEGESPITQVHIREFFKNDEGEYIPTKKGITFRPDQVNELIDALKEVSAEGNSPGDQQAQQSAV